MPSFFFFVILTLLLGGDALNGYVDDDRHFVCSHGKCKEVWPVSYDISLYTGLITVTIFFAMAVFLSCGQALSQTKTPEDADEERQGTGLDRT